MLFQSLSHAWFFATSWTAACQASLFITNSQSLLKLMSIELVIPSNPIIVCHPLLLLLSTFPSIRVFSNKLALCIRWRRYRSFGFTPSNECSGLISFRISKVLSRVFPPPQFESINSSVLSLLVHIDSKDKHDIKVILHIGFPG